MKKVFLSLLCLHDDWRFSSLDNIHLPIYFFILQYTLYIPGILLNATNAISSLPLALYTITCLSFHVTARQTRLPIEDRRNDCDCHDEQSHLKPPAEHLLHLNISVTLLFRFC